MIELTELTLLTELSLLTELTLLLLTELSLLTELTRPARRLIYDVIIDQSN